METQRQSENWLSPSPMLASFKVVSLAVLKRKYAFSLKTPSSWNEATVSKVSSSMSEASPLSPFLLDVCPNTRTVETMEKTNVLVHIFLTPSRANGHRWSLVLMIVSVRHSNQTICWQCHWAFKFAWLIDLPGRPTTAGSDHYIQFQTSQSFKIKWNKADLHCRLCGLA